MNDPWYSQRWFTRLLGAIGAVTVLVGTCTQLNEQEERERLRGDGLVTHDSAAVFSSEGSTLFGLVYNDLPGKNTTELRAWETKQGRLLWKLRVASDQEGQYSSPLMTLAANKVTIAANKAAVATLAGEALTLREGATGRLLWRISLKTTSVWAALRFSASSKLLFLADGGALTVFEVKTGQRLGRFPIFYNGANFIPYALPEETVLVPELRRVPGRQEVVTLLVAKDPRTGKLVRRIARDAEGWQMSSDSKRLLVEGKEGLRMLTPEGKSIATWSYPKGYLNNRSAAFLPEGRRVLISAYRDGYAEQLEVVWNPEANTSRAANPAERERPTTSPDGKRALVVEWHGGENNHFPLGHLQDLATGKVYAHLEGQTGW